MFLSRVCVAIMSSNFLWTPIIWSNGKVRVKIVEPVGIVISLFEQFANAIEFKHNWGAKTRSGDKAISGFSVENTSGTTWLVVVKSSGNLMIPPGGITFSVLSEKWMLEPSK